MIKAIILDLGGVVLKHSYDSFAQYLAKPFKTEADDIEALYQSIKDKWSLGKINLRDAANHYIKAFSSTHKPSHIINQWIKAHKRDIEFNKEVLDLITKLRKKYKVYLLTNTVDLHFNTIGSTGVFNYFDKVYTSFEIGKRKPDREIYEYLLNDLKIKPQECVFIDDKEENIKGAKKLNMKAILFKDHKSLKSSLEKLKLI